VSEYTSNCHSYLGLFRCCLPVEIIPANMGLDRCTTIILGFLCIRGHGFDAQYSNCRVPSFLKDPSQPLLFSMQTKLSILHGELKSLLASQRFSLL